MAVDGYNEWILGDTFMRGWYNIHDQDNSRMGFIPFPDSDKTTPEPRTEADVDPDPSSSDNGSSDPFTIPDSNDPDNSLGGEEQTQIFGIDSGTFIAVVGVTAVITVVASYVLLAICYSLSMKALKLSKRPKQRNINDEEKENGQAL